MVERAAIVTGGSRGIGRAIAEVLADEGYRLTITSRREEGLQEAVRAMRDAGSEVQGIARNLADEAAVAEIVAAHRERFGRLDVLVNNAAFQEHAESIEELSDERFDETFRTNIFGYFHMTRAAVPHLRPGSAIVNTSSITAFQGNPMLIDYSSTKGAIVSFTRALSNSLVEKGIRVNGVAPGPIWTPLIPATFPEEKVETFGQDTPMKRPGQPHEVATCFVFLASDDASYISGQFLHPNGGQVVGG
jgi:NAD(P)-dependent dehydrogenase (short-subunit alcohol dehydrogenase family)